ncbi:MAG: FtsX-like permease family protein, partial [Gemmatimonadota bacterium]
VIGLYSMLLYALVSRTREVGLRIALGARPLNASFTVLKDGLGFVLAGSIMGLALCIPAALLAGRSFIGVDAGDPMPFVYVVLTIAGSCMAASIVPARRAARTAPMEALRYE